MKDMAINNDKISVLDKYGNFRYDINIKKISVIDNHTMDLLLLS